MALLVGVVLGLVIGGGMVATAFGTMQRQRYATPYLHDEGRWGPVVVEGKGEMLRFSYTNAGHTICVGTNHGPKVCSIGPGISHVDTCDCGAQRSGVYGSWS